MIFTTLAKGRVTGESRTSTVGDAATLKARKRIAVREAVGNMLAREYERGIKAEC